MGWFASWGMLGLFAEYFLKSAIILILAVTLATASRRRSAALRHFVLSSALIGLLLLPLLSLAPLGWETALLTHIPASPAEAPKTRTNPLFSEQEARLDFKAAEALSFQEEDPPALTTASSLKIVPARRSSRSLGILNAAMAAIWSGGLFLLILRLAVGLAAAARLTSEGSAFGDPDWRLLLDRFLSFIPLKRSIRLKTHPKVLLPLTWGWKRPVILMPPDANGWAEEERSSALFHELSHIKRADFLIMLLVRFGLAVFWFNPLCWIVFRKLRKEQEIACDELVLRAGIKPSTYAASLLTFRRSAGFRWNPSAALLGIMGKGTFQERLAAILKQKLIFKEVKMKTRIMLAASVVLAVAVVGTARPASGVEKKPVAASAAVVASRVSEPAAVAPAQETKAVQAEAQAKDKEKNTADKDKAVGPTKILVKAKDGKGSPIEIVISEGDIVKTIVLDKPLTITTDKDGNFLILSSDGKELQVLKGKPIKLGIKAGDVEFIKEGKTLTVGEGQGIYIIEKADKDGAKKIRIKAGDGTWTAKDGHVHVLDMAPSDQELLDQVRKIREQVQMVKDNKLDLAEVEKSLEMLENELQANKDKIKHIGIPLDGKAGHYTIVKRIDEGESKPDLGVHIIGAEKSNSIWTLTTPRPGEDGAIELTFKQISGQEGGKAYYERILSKFKANVPADFQLESDFDEDSGTLRFKITPPKGWTGHEGLIKKLVESLKDEDKE